MEKFNFGGNLMADEKRPGAATAAAVLAIIFGALGALFGLLAVLGSLVLLGAGILGILLLVISILALGAGAIGLIGGILMLGNKKVGATLVLAYAIIAVVVNVVSFILTMAMPGGVANILGLLLGAVVPAIIFILVIMKPVKDFYAKAA
jgi:hypothetical protein